MLAMHQEVQQKVFDEVQKVANEVENDEVTDADLHKLQVLEMVIKETMRLFPVLPIHGRYASEEVQLETHTIPAGANIAISVFTAHRSKSNWGDDADLFKPERFLPENFEKIHPYSFIPFSRGEQQVFHDLQADFILFLISF